MIPLNNDDMLQQSGYVYINKQQRPTDNLILHQLHENHTRTCIPEISKDISSAFNFKKNLIRRGSSSGFIGRKMAE